MGVTLGHFREGPGDGAGVFTMSGNEHSTMVGIVGAMRSPRSLANDLIWTSASAIDWARGVAMLHAAYTAGDRHAGYDLAVLPRSWVPEEFALHREVRIELVAEQALAGNDAAALELAHTFGRDVAPEVLREALAAAAERGSVESQELLAGLFPDQARRA